MRNSVAHSLGDPGPSSSRTSLPARVRDTCGLGITPRQRAWPERSRRSFLPARCRKICATSAPNHGCQCNSCAQHHIATIGLHGLVSGSVSIRRRITNCIWAGTWTARRKLGSLREVAGESVPAAVRHLVDVSPGPEAGESLQTFIGRVGKTSSRTNSIYTIVPAYDQDPTYYYDWEGEAEFVLEDLGPGEMRRWSLAEMIDDRMLKPIRTLSSETTCGEASIRSVRE